MFDDILVSAFCSPPFTSRIEALISKWKNPESGCPYPCDELSSLSELFSDIDPPASGISFELLLDEFERDILRHTPKLNHPMYVGHMTQALPSFSAAIDALTAAINQNQVKTETAFASTLVEKQVLAWLHRLVYRSEHSHYAGHLGASGLPLGNLVSGGTIGNLTALAAALEIALPGCRELGLPAALKLHGYSDVAVLGSARMHYSLKKAMATLGMGTAALRVIPVTADNRISLEAARITLSNLRDANIKLVAIVGVAGATETGSIDPLPQLADLAREAGTWFHVDAAWGGALMLSRTDRDFLAGIERADSVVVDGHKLFYVPMSQGVVLFRQPHGLESLRHNANYILRAQSGDLGQTSLEGSRRFDALKLWAAIKLLGTDGYSAIFAHLRSLGQQFCGLLEQQLDFELITSSPTFIYTYRYIPERWRIQLHECLLAGRTEAVMQFQAAVNELNVEVQERLKRSGQGFVSRTILESTMYPGSTVVMRVVLTNVFTRKHHLAQLLQLQSEIGAALVDTGKFLVPAQEPTDCTYYSKL